ncbi:MAG: SIS domain-containing protein [Sebaldella sp.]|nr:SIS domain-containing protein [Sebaldella sp.]
MEFKHVTLKEIKQQGRVWEELLGSLDGKKEEISSFLDSIDAKNRKIIFTGAGTSEFVGNVLLLNMDDNFRSIATTDIVENPELYLHKNEKVLLVSFARSGNSPESLAAVELADQLVDDIAHLAITCSEVGKLAQQMLGKKKSYLWLTPKESNDDGFAMTSSFTCMLLSGLYIFGKINKPELRDMMNTVIEEINKNEKNFENYVNELVKLDVERIVYLGSGTLRALAEEATLKCLELSAGKLGVFYNSPLSFRHGPKSIINEKTVVITMMSNCEYTRKYEIDLLKEMHNEKSKKHLVALDVKNDSAVKENTHYYITLDNDKFSKYPEIINTFVYIYFAQLFAYNKSLSFNFNPDNPCPTGEVNRVVQGVTIYPYKK